MNANLGSLKKVGVCGLYFLFMSRLGAVMYISGGLLAPQTRLPTRHTLGSTDASEKTKDREYK